MRTYLPTKQCKITSAMMIRLLLLLLLVLTASIVSTGSNTVRENCVGTRSCRPRCITFHLHRDNCPLRQGVFKANATTTKSIAWQDFNVQCSNESSSLSSPGDSGNTLLIQIEEETESWWSFATEIELLRHEDAFTFCSIYPCPKTECTLPEQMGSVLRFNIFRGEASYSQPPILLAKVELGLTQQFEGEYFDSDKPNRLGPLEVVWMDDPSGGCRQDAFPPFAPIAPREDPFVSSFVMNFPIQNTAELFCTGNQPTTLPLATRSRFEVEIELWFIETEKIMDKQEAFRWSKLTRSYLRIKGVAVESLYVTRQQVFPALAPPDDGPVIEVSLGNRTKAQQQQLEEEEEEEEEEELKQSKPNTSSLMIEVRMKGQKVDRATELLRREWDDYLSFLRSGEKANKNAGMDSSSTTTPVVATTTTGPYNDGAENWEIVFVTLGLSLVAIVAVAAVRSSGRRRRRSNRQTRNQRQREQQRVTIEYPPVDIDRNTVADHAVPGTMVYS